MQARASVHPHSLQTRSERLNFGPRPWPLLGVRDRCAMALSEIPEVLDAAAGLVASCSSSPAPAAAGIELEAAAHD